jgi:undecaprenyl-diphosphatase
VIAVGLGQLVAAIFPGASRSGCTIILALMLGLSRPAAVEFSFLVGIPTMMAAGGLKIFKAFHHHSTGSVNEDWGMLLLCTVVAVIVSFIAVKWLLRYVRSHTFIPFGWYRIAIAIVMAILFYALHWELKPSRQTPINVKVSATDCEAPVGASRL